MLLQILEDGKITDSLGRKIDFRNTIIIMTSNVGADLIKRQTTMGFGAPTDSRHEYDTMRDKILEETKRVFKPEFLNRLDDIIVFHQLAKPDLMRIVDLEVNKVKARSGSRKEVDIELEQSANEFLIEKGYDPHYGARPMRRAVERYLEDPLAEELLKGTSRRATWSSDGAAKRSSSSASPSRRQQRRARAERRVREAPGVVRLATGASSPRYARLRRAGCASW